MLGYFVGKILSVKVLDIKSCCPKKEIQVQFLILVSETFVQNIARNLNNT
jgi:hypothetical protein